MPLRALVVSIAVGAFLAAGCSGENGCGSPPSAADPKSAPSGGGRPGTGDRGPSVEFADVKGRVPKPYRRDAAQAAAPGPLSAAGGPATARIIQRNVDGVSDKVEVFCPAPLPPPGKCLEGPHFSDMKELCCPDGVIERCKVGDTGGLHIVGRRCGPPAR